MPETPGQMPLFDVPAASGEPAGDRELRRILNEIKTYNRDLVAKLAQLQRRPDPSATLLTRLNLLIELLMPTDGERLEFEIEFEREMTRVLSGQVEQAHQQRLLDVNTPLPTNNRPLIGGHAFIKP